MLYGSTSTIPHRMADQACESHEENKESKCIKQIWSSYYLPMVNKTLIEPLLYKLERIQVRFLPYLEHSPLYIKSDINAESDWLKI